MNAAVKEHILQKIDWSRFDLEGWLYQFGAWMQSCSGVCGKSINPIAVAMDNAVKARKYKKLTEEQQVQILADYICGNGDLPKPRRGRIKCQINDNEARAVQRLILDMQNQSEILDDWMDAIISRYFYGNSWSAMKTKMRTEMDAKFDVRCGLAALHSRYQFITYK